MLGTLHSDISSSHHANRRRASCHHSNILPPRSCSGLRSGALPSILHKRLELLKINGTIRIAIPPLHDFTCYLPTMLHRESTLHVCICQDGRQIIRGDCAGCTAIKGVESCPECSILQSGPLTQTSSAELCVINRPCTIVVISIADHHHHIIMT